MGNIILAIVAGAFNGLGDFFTKLTAGKISPYLGGILLCLGSAATVAFYLVFIKGLHGNTMVTKAGVLYALLGGVAIGIGVICFFLIFNRGMNLSTAQPIVKTTLIIVAVLLGVIFMKERLSVSQIIGLLLSLAGIYFLTK